MAADGTITRVELEDGNWLELRTRQTLADVKALELSRMERGGTESGALDMISILDRLVVAWSYPLELTSENIENTIAVNDLTSLTEALQSPNTSRPSSNGSTKAKVGSKPQLAGE